MAKAKGIRAKSKATGKVMFFANLKMVNGKACYSDGKVATAFTANWIVLP